MARKNSLEWPKPRKKPREEPGYVGWPVLFWRCRVEIINLDEPGYVGWPVLFWLCRVDIITEHGQDVQMFIDDYS